MNLKKEVFISAVCLIILGLPKTKLLYHRNEVSFPQYAMCVSYLRGSLV